MILVTGASGFLGTELLKQLINENENVRALKRSNSVLRMSDELKNKIEWVDGDVTDVQSVEDAMQGCSKVYHCAAIVSFNPKAAAHMMQVNVNGTANVVNTALHLGIEKLLYVSSIASLGRSLGNDHLTEESKWEESKLNSKYALSKYGGEMEVWRGIAEGLNAVIINPSVIIGAGKWDEGTAKFFNDAWKGIPFYTKGVTGFVGVKDVAAVMIHLMESDIVNERFIVNAENMVYQDFFNQVCDGLGKPHPKIHMPAWMGELAWRAEWLRSKLTGKPPMAQKENVRVALTKFYYSSEKLKQKIGFEFTPMKKVIAETCEEFLKSV